MTPGTEEEGFSHAICPIEFRYGRKETKAIFDRDATLARYLKVEGALAQALAEEGVIPKEAAQDIAMAVQQGKVALRRVDELEAQTHHDVMALVKALTEVANRGGPYVHMGATSNDILDTARGLELKEAAELLRSSLNYLISSLVKQVDLHKATIMVGRTHGQHAVPTTFGYKLATFTAELLRHRKRLDEMMGRLAVGKMAGAVGTGASFGDLSEKLEKRTMALLGLQVEDAPTQITGRDRLAEFAFWIAMVASTLDRLATEVRNLQRTEIAELSEPFEEGKQVGSSTMAQKRNPINSENVSSLARLLRALPQPALENMVQWHERDLANSANERFLYSHGVILLDEMLTRMRAIVSGWRVCPDRMLENLSMSGGAVMAEALMLELTRRGLGRQEAHELLRNLTRDLKPKGKDSLLSRAKTNDVVKKWIKEEEMERYFTPAAYAQVATDKTVRLLAGFRKDLKQG
jgi:adenylosuccinate lyase